MLSGQVEGGPGDHYRTAQGERAGYGIRASMKACHNAHADFHQRHT
jgi:hypothetical protein